MSNEKYAHEETLERGLDSKIVDVADVAYIPPSGAELTDEEQRLDRRVNLKMDFFMFPMLILLYLFQSIDKTNIGNAGTSTIVKDAHLSENAINNGVSLLYATLVPFAPIGTALGKKFGMTRWIPLTMFCWGIVTVGNGFISGDGSLYACRLLVGMFEGGFYPGCCWFLSTCYPRFVLAFRLAIFYGVFSIAGAFSSLIAYGLLSIESTKLRPWQYMFMIEGCITIALSIIGFLYLPAQGCDSWFLSAKEKAWAAERMRRDQGDGHQAKAGIDWIDIREALKDWKVWIIVPANVLTGIQTHALTTFMPIILQSLGYQGVRANLFSIPPYVVGAVFMWIMAYSSDRCKERTWHLLICTLPSLLGLILVSVLHGAQARYAALCIMNMGSYASSPLVASSILNNTPRPGTRAVIIAINGWGNLAGIISSQLYVPKYKPSYSIPFYVSLACTIVGFMLYFAYRMALVTSNKYRAKKVAAMTPEEIAEENSNMVRIGDKKWTFVYTT